MLVITGMGRSGTSVLATLCKRLKYNPGGDYVEGINAGLEDPEVVAINEAILGPAPGDDARRQIAGRIKSCRRKVIKDPRFILAGGTALRVWWQERQDLRVLLAIRDPLEVIRLRQRIRTGSARSPTRGPRFFRTTSPLLLRHERTGIPFRRLHFPDFLRQPEQVFDALRFGGLSFWERRCGKEWQQLIDYSKVRHSPRWRGTVTAPSSTG